MCGMRDSSPEDHVTTAWRIILYIEHTIQLVRLTGKVITQKYIGQPTKQVRCSIFLALCPVQYIRSHANVQEFGIQTFWVKALLTSEIIWKHVSPGTILAVAPYSRDCFVSEETDYEYWEFQISGEQSLERSL